MDSKTAKPAVVKVSSGNRIRVPDNLAKQAGITDDSYVEIGFGPEHKGLIIKPLHLSF
jgi:hypothetical protein